MPNDGRAQTIYSSTDGCEFSASSYFTGPYIRSYTYADLGCVEDTGIWMQCELGGSWYSYSLTYAWYYIAQQSPSGATDNWTKHQICTSFCGQWEYTWVP
jgi:hypothetical protein